MAIQEKLVSCSSAEFSPQKLLDRIETLETALYELRLQQLPAQRGGADYLKMIRHLRQTVRQHLPAEASVIVVSKGDDELLQLHGRRGEHFPQNSRGGYAGFYPSGSLSAIAQLESLRYRGADYLLFPATALWWREKYPEFYRHLERRYRLVVEDREACAIFSLRQPSPWHRLDDVLIQCRARLGREPVLLDWDTGCDLAKVFSDCVVFSPPQPGVSLPYLDKTIDLVALKAPHPTAEAEAKRVAAQGVIKFQIGPNERFEMQAQWQQEAGTGGLPTTSILIPWDDATDGGCLAAVLETLPVNFQGEILLVEASEGGKLNPQHRPLFPSPFPVKTVRVPCSPETGWPSRATSAARAATSEILVFLSSEVLPLPGWLPALLQVFASHPKAGVIGSRLLQPDGQLQEAGGLVQADGSYASFGAGDFDADAAKYNFVRVVDFCSGALLATRRTLFEENGGFAITTDNGCGADADYCARLRERGWRVYYQPASSAVCLETTLTPPAAAGAETAGNGEATTHE